MSHDALTPPMSRRHLLAAAAVALVTGSRAAEAAPPDWLITPQEVARSAAAKEEQPAYATRMAGAPLIEVLRPTIGEAALPSPVPIELAFKPAADAAIDVASFRVFYGAFKIDVTPRLLKTVVVKPEGLKVDQAASPSGTHRLVLQVAVTQGRQATRELRFTVA